MSRKDSLMAACACVCILGIVVGFGADSLLRASPDPAARQEVNPALSLPVTRIVLFNSGVGYFRRSGEIVDDARIDLTFPEHDINDLLKSMVLEDFGKGRIAAVSYDSREPIARTLSSFAINLTGDPSFAGIISQMRGERVEIVLSPGAANQPGKLAGTIVGIEHQHVASGSTTVEVEVLNMWCAEGLRSVKLQEIQQLKFANPMIESEFRRALDVLAVSHDSQKKAVSVHFAGEGKRKVSVGYVIEAPIWKTSYRLVMAENEKPYLQGWAMVENPTDEDWSGVRMALISGRPISFQMDLYNQLYINRPIVEPELFASLRPVTYRGGFGRGEDQAEIKRLFEQYRNLTKEGKYIEAEKVALQARQLDPDNPTCAALVEQAKLLRAHKDADKLKDDKERMFRLGLNKAEEEGPLVDIESPIASQLNRSRIASQRGSGEAATQLGQRLQTGAVGNAATASSLGDFFQYTIDHPVSLARQKSALLPIVGKSIEGQHVSIYNENVQSRHPLLGFKFKNTTGLHLNQGPITVFEGSVYAGDTRVLDVQPDEERLISYAIDLGVEIDPQISAPTQKITFVKAVKGIVTTHSKLTEEKKYRIVNRGQTDRTLVIEHPNRSNQQFALVDTAKPVEDTPDFWRFQVAIKAGASESFTVKEEKSLEYSLSLTNSPDETIHYFMTLNEVGSALKQGLAQALKLRAQMAEFQEELKGLATLLVILTADQDRIRKNLRETPREAEVYATYLKKLSEQEKEIDALTSRQKKVAQDELTSRKTYEEFLANLPN